MRTDEQIAALALRLAPNLTMEDRDLLVAIVGGERAFYDVIDSPALRRLRTMRYTALQTAHHVKQRMEAEARKREKAQQRDAFRRLSPEESARLIGEEATRIMAAMPPTTSTGVPLRLRSDLPCPRARARAIELAQGLLIARARLIVERAGGVDYLADLIMEHVRDVERHHRARTRTLSRTDVRRMLLGLLHDGRDQIIHGGNPSVRWGGVKTFCRVSVARGEFAWSVFRE